MKMEKFMRVNGRKIKNMDKDNLHIQIMIYIMDNSQIIEKKDMVHRFMQMVKNMKEIGLITKEMVMENSILKMKQFMKDNLKMIKLKELEN